MIPDRQTDDANTIFIQFHQGITNLVEVHKMIKVLGLVVSKMKISSKFQLKNLSLACVTSICNVMEQFEQLLKRTIITRIIPQSLVKIQPVV